MKLSGFFAIRIGHAGNLICGGSAMLKFPITLAIILLPTVAFAQSPPPKVGNKPLTQVKPIAPGGCKLVGTVRGTKLWAGDCVAPEQLRGSTLDTANSSLASPDGTTPAVQPGQKE
jgi:hypothetical protein